MPNDDLNINIKVTADKDNAADRRLAAIEAGFGGISKAAAATADTLAKTGQGIEKTLESQLALTKELREARERYEAEGLNKLVQSSMKAASAEADFNKQLEREIELRQQLAAATKLGSNADIGGTRGLQDRFQPQLSETELGPKPLPFKGSDPRELFIGGFGIRSAAGLAGLAAGDRQAPAAQALTGLSDLVLLASGAAQIKGILGSIGNAVAAFGGQLAGSLSALPGVLGTTLAAMNPLTLGIVAIGTVAAVATVAIIEYTAAQDEKVKADKEARETLLALIKVQDDYYKFIQTATTEDVKQKISDKQKEINSNKQIAAANASILDRVKNDTLKEVTEQRQRDVKSGIPELLAGSLDPEKIKKDAADLANTRIENNEALKAAKDANEKATKAVKDGEIQLEQWKAGLTDATVAMNDGKKALDALHRSTVQIVEGRTQTDNELAKLSRTGNVDQVQEAIASTRERIENLKAEQNALGALKDTNEEARKKYELLDAQLNIQKDKLDKLTGGYDLQGRTLTQIAQAREREEEAAKALQKTLEEGAKAFLKRAEIEQEIDQRQAKFDEETKNIVEKRRTDDLRDQIDFQTKRAKEVRDFGTKTAQEDARNALNRAQKLREIEQIVPEAVNKVEKERIEKLIKFQLEEARRAEDHLEKLAQIEREGKTKSLEAAAKLDAWGVLNAQRAMAEKTMAENASYNKEKRRRDEDFQRSVQQEIEHAKMEADTRKARALQQLADDDEQQKLRREQELEAFNTKLQDEDQQRQTERQRRLEDYATQDRLRAAAFTNSLADLRSKLEEEGEKIKRAGDAIFPYVGDQVSNFFDGLRKSAEGLGLGLPQIQLPSVNDVNNLLQQAADNAAANPAPMSYFAGDVLSGITGGATDGWTNIINQAASVGQDIFSSLGGLFGGFFAGGGEPEPGKIVRVGEQGPEWAVFQDKVKIYGNDSGFNGGGVSIGTLSIPIDLRGQNNIDAEKVAELVPPAVRKAIIAWGQEVANG